MSVCTMGKVPMCVEERRQSIPLDVDDKQKTLPMCVESMRRGGRGLPAISGIVDTPADLPDAAEHWLENWLVKDATNIYNSEMALFSARAVISGQKAWEYIGSIKGEDGFSPAVTITSVNGGHYVTITDKEHPDGQNFLVKNGKSFLGVFDTFQDIPNTAIDGDVCIVRYDRLFGDYILFECTNSVFWQWEALGSIQGPKGEDGTGIRLYNTDADLPNAFTVADGSLAIVRNSNGTPYYLYEDIGTGWFGRGSLKGDKGDRGDMPFWFGTKAEYNALSEIDPDVCYCIEEGT